MNRIQWILFGLLVWSSFVLQAQTTKSFSSLHFSEDHGLEASDVYGIDQDQNGYIWIGSNGGVYRFDGTFFEHFGVPEGIESRVISKVYCLEDESILLIGEQPFAQYIVKDREVTRLSLFPGLSFPGFITMMDEDDGLWFYSAVNRELKRCYKGEKETFKADIRGMVRPFAWRDDEVFISSDRVGYVTFKDDVFEEHIIEEFPSEVMRAVIEDNHGVFWGMGDRHLFRFSESGGWSAVLEHGIEQDVHMTWDNDDRLWISGVDDGLFMYALSEPKLRRMDLTFDLENVQITDLFLDKQGNVWLATAGNGLKCVLTTPFVSYTMEDGLLGNYVTALYKSNSGHVWIGTNSGLNNIYIDDQDQATLKYKVDAVSEDGYIYDLSELDDGTILCATRHAKSQVSKIDGFSHDILYYANCALVHHMDSGICFFGTWYNFYQMDAVQRYNLVRPNEAIRSSRVNQVEGNSDSAWILTSTCFMKMVGSRLDTIWDVSGSLSIQLTGFVRNSDGSYWVGTSAGLHRLSGDEKLVYDVAKGLPSNHCLSLTKDDDGSCWVGTDRGLCQLTPSGDVRTFTRGNGLPSNHIGVVLYDGHQNRLWIGTSKGVSSILIDDIQSIRSVSFPLFVNGLEVIGDTFFMNPDKVSLSASQNDLRVHFQALSYTHPSEVLYQYKFSDDQSEWKETTSNFAEFYALAPGDYEFSVRSKISGASWGPLAMVSFNIVPPITQRWYFWMTVFLAFSFFAYVLARLRIANVRKDEVQKRKTLSTINQLEQRALHASMNPHFIFNTLNGIQQIFAKHKDPKGIDFVAEFATLVRANMEAARTKNTSLGKEIENLERYLKLEKERLDGKMDYEIVTDTELSVEDIDIPSMLIQPFVENAIWHGIAPSSSSGKVTLSFYETEGMLVVKILDNGVGLSEDKEVSSGGHISRGIQLTRERLRMLSDRNSLSISPKIDADGKSIGTEVELVLEIS